MCPEYRVTYVSGRTTKFSEYSNEELNSIQFWRGSRVRHRSSPDDDLDPAVFLPALRVVRAVGLEVWSHGLLRAVAAGEEVHAAEAALHDQPLPDGCRSPFRQLLVVRLQALRVGVTFDRDFRARVGLQYGHDLLERWRGFVLYVRLVEVEEHVRRHGDADLR